MHHSRSHTRHKFSPESYTDLKQFLDLVANQDVRESEKSKFWKKILPKDENLVLDIKKIGNKSNIEVVDLCDESDDIPQDNNLMPHIVTVVNEIENNDKDVIEIAIKLQQHLMSEAGLSSEMLKNLISECNSNNLDELFIYLRNCLESELIYLFGYSILHSNCFENNQIAGLFCQYLLIEKLLEEGSTKYTNIFDDFLNALPQVVCPEIIKSLINIKEKCPMGLQEILNNLNTENKQKILKEFILNSTKIECGQFLILESLLVGDLDLGIIKKLIELLVTSANQFNTNKSFGKLLHNVIKNIGNHLHFFKEELRVILANHKSVWHKKASEALENCSEQHSTSNFSQTFHF